MQISPPRNQESPQSPSVLAVLRALHPDRPLRLRGAPGGRITGDDDAAASWRDSAGPVPTEMIAAQPRIVVEYDNDAALLRCQRLGHSDGAGIITLNAEPIRVRLTTVTSTSTSSTTASQLTGHVSPLLRWRLRIRRRLLRRLSAHAQTTGDTSLVRGNQRTPELAALFDVSAVAMRVRLSQLGLAAAPYTREARNQSMRADCARRPGHRYERQLSAHWPLGPANSKSLLDALELDR